MPPAETPVARPPKKKKKTIERLLVTRRVDYVPPEGSERSQRSQRRAKRTRRYRVRGQIRYRLAARAKVEVTISRRGRRGGYATKGVVRRGGKAKARIPLARLTRKVRFRPGVYRVSLIATDREGNSSRRRASFRVVPVR